MPPTICSKHGIELQPTCDEDTCGLCYAEELAQTKLGGPISPWSKHEVEMYYAAHLAHGKIEEYHEKGYKV